jgi:hypothetical protein
MKRVAYYRWRLPDELRPGRTYRCKWLMSEETAAGYPGAVKDGETPAEYRDEPETPEERMQNDTSHLMRPNKPPVSGE